MTRHFRLDELAHEAGVASTTVRLYQNKGLLRPPRLEGRTGWYDESHLARLEVIARLQADGFSLAGIGRLLDRWREGGGLDGLLGVEAQLDELLGAHGALTVPFDELLERFPADAMTPELVQRAAALELIELTASGAVRVMDRRFLDAGATLARLGVPLGEVLDQWEELREHTDTIATRFVDVFERHLLPADWRDGLTEEGASDLAATLSQLQAMARLVLAAGLDASLASIGRARLGDLIPDQLIPD